MTDRECSNMSVEGCVLDKLEGRNIKFDCESTVNSILSLPISKRPTSSLEIAERYALQMGEVSSMVLKCVSCRQGGE